VPHLTRRAWLAVGLAIAGLAALSVTIAGAQTDVQRLIIDHNTKHPPVSLLDDLRANWIEGGRWIPSMDAATRDRLFAQWKKAVTRTLDWVDADTP